MGLMLGPGQLDMNYMHGLNKAWTNKLQNCKAKGPSTWRHALPLAYSAIQVTPYKVTPGQSGLPLLEGTAGAPVGGMHAKHFRNASHHFSLRESAMQVGVARGCPKYEDMQKLQWDRRTK